MSNVAVQSPRQPEIISGWSVEVLDDILERASDGGTVSIELTGLSEVHTFGGKSLIWHYDRKEAERRSKAKTLKPEEFARFDVNFGGRLARTHEVCEGSLTSLHYKDDEKLFRRGIIGECTLDVVHRSEFNPTDQPVFTFDLLVNSEQRCREISERLSVALNAGNRVLLSLEFVPPDDLDMLKKNLLNKGSSGALHVSNFEVEIQVGVWEGRFPIEQSKTA